MEGQNITVEELTNKIDTCLELKEEYGGLSRKAKDAHSELKKAQGEIIAILEDMGRDSFDTNRVKFSYRHSESFKTPKDIEAKQALAEYIKEKHGEEYFWNLFSVNSRSLQGFAKTELEAAEDDNDYNFELPGCERTTSDPIAYMRATGK